MTKLIHIIGWNRLSQKWRLVVLAVAALTVLFVSSHYYFHRHPDGIYYETDTDIYQRWVFDKGKVYAERPDDLSESVVPRRSGHYTQDNCVIPDGKMMFRDFSFSASIFGITFKTKLGESYETRFLPRKWVLNAEHLLRIPSGRYGNWDAAVSLNTYIKKTEYRISDTNTPISPNPL